MQATHELQKQPARIVFRALCCFCYNAPAGRCSLASCLSPALQQTGGVPSMPSCKGCSLLFLIFVRCFSDVEYVVASARTFGQVKEAFKVIKTGGLSTATHSWDEAGTSTRTVQARRNIQLMH